MDRKFTISNIKGDGEEPATSKAAAESCAGLEATVKQEEQDPEQVPENETSDHEMDRKFTISNIKGDGEEPATSKAAAESCTGLEATVKQEEQEQQDPEQVPENETSDHEMDRKFTISNIKGDGEEPATSKAAAESCAGLEATVKQEKQEQQDPEQVQENENSDHEMDRKFTISNIKGDGEEPATSKAAAERCAGLEATVKQEEEEQQDPEQVPENEESDHDIEEMDFPFPNLQCEIYWDMIEDFPDFLRPTKLKANTSAENIIELRPTWGPYYSSPLGFCTSSTSVASSSASASTVASKSVTEQLRKEPQEPENSAESKNGVLQELLKWYKSDEYIIESRRLASGPNLSTLLGFTTPSTSVGSSSASASTVGSKSVADQKSDVKSEVPSKEIKANTSAENIIEHRPALGPNLNTLLGFTTPSPSVGSSSASASAVGSKNVADRKSDVKSEVPTKKIKANTIAGNIIEHRPALGPNLSTLLGFTTPSTSVVSSSASAFTVGSKSVADQKSDAKSEVSPKKIKANTIAGNIIEHRPAWGPNLRTLLGFTTPSTSVGSSSASAYTVGCKSVADRKSDVKSEVPPKKIKANTSAENIIEYRPAWGPNLRTLLGFTTPSTSVGSSSASASTAGSKSVADQTSDVKSEVPPKKIKANTSAENIIEHRPAWGPHLSSLIGFTASSTSVVSSSASASTVDSKSVADPKSDAKSEVPPKN